MIGKGSKVTAGLPLLPGCGFGACLKNEFLRHLEGVPAENALATIVSGASQLTMPILPLSLLESRGDIPACKRAAE